MPQPIDRPPLTPEQQAIAESCLGLAWQIALRYAHRRPRLRDEYVSAAMLALVEAATTYDPAIARFTSYAHDAILWRMREVNRTTRPQGWRRQPQLVPPETHAISEVDVDRLDARNADVDWVDDLEAFEVRIAVLDERSRQLLRLVFISGCSLSEIANRMGLCRERVRQLYVEAVCELGGTCTAFPRHLIGSSRMSHKLAS